MAITLPPTSAAVLYQQLVTAIYSANNPDEANAYIDGLLGLMRNEVMAFTDVATVGPWGQTGEQIRARIVGILATTPGDPVSAAQRVALFAKYDDLLGYELI